MHLTRPFLDAFCSEVLTIYQAYSPACVAPTGIELDLDEKDISFHFYIMHPRELDKLIIQFVENTAITCDLILGYDSLPLCCIDEYGLRWIIADSSEFHQRVREVTELLIRDIYQLCQEHKVPLQFLLGSKELLKEKAPG